MRITLTKKIFINFLILSIVPIIVIDSYFYFKSRKALIDRTFDQLTTLRIEKTNRLKDFFDQRFNFLENIASLQSTESLFHTLQKKTTLQHANFSPFEKDISLIIGKNHPYRRIILIPENNTLWNLDLDHHFNPEPFEGDSLETKAFWLAYEQSLKFNKPVIYDVKNKFSSKYHSILMAYAVIKNKQKLGTIILEISLKAINKIMFENNPYNGLGKTGETYLVGADYYMRSSSRFRQNSIFNIKVNTIGVQEAFKNITGTRQIRDYRNIRVLSSYSKVDIPQLNWVILAEIDTAEAMVPIHLIRNDIIFMSIILSILLMGLVEIFSSKITAPIKKLKQETDKISRGEPAALVNAKSGDEIGDLILAFNKMIKQLKDQSEKLQNERMLRTQSMLDGQEMERQRLSRELHDSLGQSILALKMKFEQIGETIEPKSKNLILEIDDLFVKIMREVRNISNDLMPAVLSEFGLIMTLSKITRELGENTGMQIDFENKSIHESFDKKLEVYIYRIVQETFSNIVKHARATRVSLSFVEKGNHIELRICDNGKGFLLNQAVLMKGNGISNIKERLNLLGGKLDISSEPGKGSCIFCIIPIQKSWKK